jgi:hypothetical protein
MLGGILTDRRTHTRSLKADPSLRTLGEPGRVRAMATTVIRLPSAAFGHSCGPAGRLGGRLMACGKAEQE